MYLCESSKSEDLFLDNTVTVSRQKFSVYSKNSATKLASSSTLLIWLGVVFCKIIRILHGCEVRI